MILMVAGSSPALCARAKALIQLPGAGNPEWIHSIKLTAGKDRHHARVDQSVDQVETHAIKYAGSTPASGSSAKAPI